MKTNQFFKEYFWGILFLITPSIIIFSSAFPSLIIWSFSFFSIVFFYAAIHIKSLWRILSPETNISKPLIAFSRLYLFIFSILLVTMSFAILENMEILFISEIITKSTFLIIISIVLFASGFFIYFLFEFIAGLFGYLKSPNGFNIKNNKDKFILVSLIIATFILPDFVFGLLYFLAISIFNPDIINEQYFLFLFDSYYVGFLIHYGLPLTSESVGVYIEIVNDNGIVRIIQICHITICKFFDLTFISIIFNYIIHFFNKFIKSS
ncbi:hypothetical protein [Peribacillus loiseleuriae]|uniref:Uncharacterized protein n=1 Tax=Peribacillus loiseleuriae TaxID=1679170 RepID=A0A0K9GV78_9BACI|nr:hypothetical protein [Peribacillus loiseleuriae]KMY50528.1 hypothetical protein AC625_14290 [Peribacillus loiseleuriae]